jgi:SNARE protein
MGCIFIAILVLIIMSALGYDAGKFNVPDEVKPTSSSTNSTASTTSTATSTAS